MIPLINWLKNLYVQNKKQNKIKQENTEELKSNDNLTEPIVLHPLTTILRLYSLYFHPFETKLTFYHYGIRFDRPNQLQGSIRTISQLVHGEKACRNDVTLLKNIIEEFIRDYDINEDEEIKIFAMGAIKGLEKLRNCYFKNDPNTPIVHCLEFYIKILQEAIISPKTENKITYKRNAEIEMTISAARQSTSILSERERISRFVEIQDQYRQKREKDQIAFEQMDDEAKQQMQELQGEHEEKEKEKDDDEIKIEKNMLLWSAQTIKILIATFSEMENTKDKNDDTYLNFIDHLISSKEYKFNQSLSF